MIERYLEAKILSKVPSAVDKGIIYTQIVKIETKNRVELNIFDQDVLVTSDMVGKIKKIVLMTDVYEEKTELVVDKKPTILKIFKLSYGMSSDRLKLIIKFIQLKDGKDIIVDTSFGNILLPFTCYKIFKNFKVGDFIKLETGRLDLDEVLD